MMLAYDQTDDTEAERFREKLGKIVHDLESEARRRVTLRRTLEERWIDNLRQYYGRYDATSEKRLKARKTKSKLSYNITRPLTKTMTARLVDLLFPTDDRNWAIRPTPVPELTREAAAAVAEAEAAEDKAQEAAEQGDEVAAQEQGAVASAARTKAASVTAIQDEARRRAEAMEAEIDDVMKECRYEASARDVIRDACMVGTGIMKGPVRGDRIRRRWTTEGKVATLEVGTERKDRPSFFRVDYWTFFPDPDVRSIEDSEGDYIRHLMKRPGLRKLARMDGFDRKVISELLKADPNETAPQYMIDLRGIISDQHDDLSNDFYHVWEYNGPLTPDQMACLAMAVGDEETTMEMADIDPLSEVKAVVWFCQGKLLKFALHPLDSGEPIYSIFNLEKDEGSIWGFGIPEIVSDPQRAASGAFRLIMDNAKLSAEPQVEVNRDIIEPQRGEGWELVGGKIWVRKLSADPNTPGIRVTHIESNQEQLAAIIEISKNHADDTASLPMIARGEPGTQALKTAAGTALYMNSANVVFRDVVKNYDDDVTTRDIRRCYDWLMQFSDKEEIKGDYEIDARGTMLLVREMQAQNLMALALNFGGHPVYGPATKHLEVYREIWRAHMLAPDQFVLSQAEYEAEMERIAGAQQTGEDPRRLELEQDALEAKVHIANQDSATRLKVAEMERDTQMMALAEKLNMDEAKLMALMDDKAQERKSKERSVAAEIAVRARPQAPLNETQIANA